jgi:hypothetical protein
VGTEPRELDTSQEWELGEPLRRSIESLPLQPGASARDALSEAKPLVEAELSTVALLERRRHLTDEEQRQARELQRFLAAIEKARVEIGAR